MQSRRVFLKNGAFALVSLGFAPSFVARTAYAQGRARAKQLITIFQRGAVDGLSVVVPFGDSEYYRARPSIAIARPGANADGTGDACDLATCGNDSREYDESNSSSWFPSIAGILMSSRMTDGSAPADSR